MTTEVDKTLQDRNSTHGDYKEQATMSMQLRDYIRTGVKYATMTPPQRDALDMIMVKVSRIITGNPHHADSWHDIAGYARLVEKELTKWHLEKKQ